MESNSNIHPNDDVRSIYVQLTLNKFIDGIQRHYLYRVETVCIHTIPSDIEPNMVIPMNVSIHYVIDECTCSGDRHPSLIMFDFIQIFDGVPLITLSSEDFKDEETLKQVAMYPSRIWPSIKDRQPVYPIDYAHALWMIGESGATMDLRHIPMIHSYYTIEAYKRFKLEHVDE